MTSFDRKHLWEIQAIRDVLLIAGGLSVLWLGHALSSITIPLLVALLLAYLVEPLVEGLGRRGVSRSALLWPRLRINENKALPLSYNPPE